MWAPLFCVGLDLNKQVIALLNSDSDGEDSPPFSTEPSDGADWQHSKGGRGSSLQVRSLGKICKIYTEGP